ncbi:hypothetical protein BJF91_20815 [Allorhizobium taibaishanense]|uniref:Uncharacterized protein n=1 Tax=Allorhizobium taibaishanense TaxID=887144 RepID=A0A1Q9A4K3_9HYPH|nr:hypothetical protein BJF91_20815 [Allorhizobium taibaishanense]
MVFWADLVNKWLTRLSNILRSSIKILLIDYANQSVAKLTRCTILESVEKRQINGKTFKISRVQIEPQRFSVLLRLSFRENQRPFFPDKL